MTNINEAKTRQEIIDKRLLKSGWDVHNPSQVTSEPVSYTHLTLPTNREV